MSHHFPGKNNYPVRARYGRYVLRLVIGRKVPKSNRLGRQTVVGPALGVEWSRTALIMNTRAMRAAASGRSGRDCARVFVGRTVNTKAKRKYTQSRRRRKKQKKKKTDLHSITIIITSRAFQSDEGRQIVDTWSRGVRFKTVLYAVFFCSGGRGAEDQDSRPKRREGKTTAAVKPEKWVSPSIVRFMNRGQNTTV